MVGLAERVDPIECAHALEAQVRELRLIAAHKPRYNRRSKFPERSVWLKLTVEAFPRLSIVRDVKADGASYLGPLRTQRQAEAVRDAIHDAVPLRQCTDRLSLRRVVRAACVLAGIGRCARPVRGRHRPAATTPRSSGWWPPPGAATSAPLVEPLRAQAGRPVGRAALRAGRRRARPHHRRGPRLRADAAAGVAARGRRARGRPARRRRRLGAVGGPRPGGWPPPGARRRGVPPWPVIEALRATADVVDDVPPAAGRGDRVHPALARGTRHPARPTPATRGRCPRSAPAACGPTWPTPAATAADPFADRRRLPMVSAAGPGIGLTGRSPRRDGRQRLRMTGMITAIVMIAVEADKIPEVAAGDRRPRRRQRGLLGRRRRRPDRHRAGTRVRRDRRRHRRAAVQGRRASCTPTPTSRSAPTPGTTSRPRSRSASSSGWHRADAGRSAVELRASHRCRPSRAASSSSSRRRPTSSRRAGVRGERRRAGPAPASPLGRRACSTAPQPADHQHDHDRGHDRVAAEPHDRAAGTGVGQRVDVAGRTGSSRDRRGALHAARCR